MEVVEASIVMLPRFTTLVAGASSTGFTTLPLDVSRFSGAQFQFWRNPGPGSLSVYLEESLDSQTWALGAYAPKEYVVEADQVRFFSYSFLMRWFRLRVVLGANSMITCWAEGLLRGGGPGGPWGGGLAPGREASGDGSTVGTAGGPITPPIPDPMSRVDWTKTGKPKTPGSFPGIEVPQSPSMYEIMLNQLGKK